MSSQDPPAPEYCAIEVGVEGGVPVQPDQHGYFGYVINGQGIGDEWSIGDDTAIFPLLDPIPAHIRSRTQFQASMQETVATDGDGTVDSTDPASRAAAWIAEDRRSNGGEFVELDRLAFRCVWCTQEGRKAPALLRVFWEQRGRRYWMLAPRRKFGNAKTQKRTITAKAYPMPTRIGDEVRNFVSVCGRCSKGLMAFPAYPRTPFVTLVRTDTPTFGRVRE